MGPGPRLRLGRLCARAAGMTFEEEARPRLPTQVTPMRRTTPIRPRSTPIRRSGIKARQKLTFSVMFFHQSR